MDRQHIPRRAGRRTLLAAAAAFCLAGAATAALADSGEWPTRPIRLVVPYPAGGNADSTARALAMVLGERLHQTIIVDNRPGAGGSIGDNFVAKAPADGYTLLLDATSFTVNPALLPRLPYDAAKDFAPVSLLTRAPLLLVVPANSPLHSVQELESAARANPGQLSFASAGTGGAQHLTGELFERATKTSLTHIPYKGGAPALTDLVGGQVSMMFSATSASGPLVRDGKLRALAVTASARAGGFPTVPTLKEAGIPGMEVYEWNGLFAPAGTPPKVLARLESETRAAVTGPQLQRRWAEMGVQGVGSSAADFRRFLQAESKRWSGLIRSAGISVE